MSVPQPQFAAVVLAGGRSSRLHASAPTKVPDKPLLEHQKHTLLETTLRALQDNSVPHSSIMVVGPEELELPAGTPQVREEPVFAGPFEALRTGIQALGEILERPDHTWVFLCGADMPFIKDAIPALVQAVQGNTQVAGEDTPQVFVGRDGGYAQPLAAVANLAGVLQAFTEPSPGSSIMRHLRKLPLEFIELPEGSTNDIDTWDDYLALKDKK